MCAEGCEEGCLQVSFKKLENPGIAYVNMFLNVWVKLSVHTILNIFKHK